MLTTEQLRARAESLGLDFFIERRAGIWVKEWLNDGCTSATAEEVMMWSMLANREAQPVGKAEITKMAAELVRGDYLSKLWTEAEKSRHVDTHRLQNLLDELHDVMKVKAIAITRLLTAPPAPAVPDDYQHLKNVQELYHKQEERLFALAQRIKGALFDKYSHTTAQAIDMLEREVFGEDGDACRAAMLAQPVSSGYTLPDGWVACSEQMPEVGERDWRTALPVLVKCEIGVIPAYYGFTYHEGEQRFGFMESIKFGDGSGSGPEQHENRLMMHVTHWMPLPAAPESGNG